MFEVTDVVNLNTKKRNISWIHKIKEEKRVLGENTWIQIFLTAILYNESRTTLNRHVKSQVRYRASFVDSNNIDPFNIT